MRLLIWQQMAGRRVRRHCVHLATCPLCCGNGAPLCSSMLIARSPCNSQWPDTLATLWVREPVALVRMLLGLLVIRYRTEILGFLGLNFSHLAGEVIERIEIGAEVAP